jgi:hypothetical protein
MGCKRHWRRRRLYTKIFLILLFGSTIPFIALIRRSPWFEKIYLSWLQQSLIFDFKIQDTPFMKNLYKNLSGNRTYKHSMLLAPKPTVNMALTHFNPVYNVATYFPKINFSIILSAHFRSSKWMISTTYQHWHSIRVSYFPHPGYMSILS